MSETTDTSLTKTEEPSSFIAYWNKVLAEAQVWWKGCMAIFGREFFGYFRTPIAYVFMTVTLIALNGIVWSNIGYFFERENASLHSYFNLFPWVYLILIPAVGMRLWAEEKRSGTHELLLTSPITPAQAVVAKFLAAWCFVTITVLMTVTMPITVEILGTPDWGPIFTGYFGAILMAGAYISVCSLASSLTRNQVIAFILGIAVCLILLLAGFGTLTEYLVGIGLPTWLVDVIASFSFAPHFDTMTKGLITFRDFTYFIAVITASLGLNILAIQRR